MGFVVVYDANVLYPATLRDVLIRVAQAGLVQARWTNQILGETFESIMKQRPDREPAKPARTRELMSGAIRDCLVTGYEPLIEVSTRPDPDDRHVLAAAIRARAQVIETSNIKDSPTMQLAPGTLRRRRLTSFSSTSSTSTARLCTAPSSAWPTVGRTRPARSTTSWTRSKGQASWRQRPACDGGRAQVGSSRGGVAATRPTGFPVRRMSALW